MVQPPSDSHGRPATATDGIVNTEEAWNDTGDEPVATSPCSPLSGNICVLATKSPSRTPSSGAHHSSKTTLEASPYPSHYPGGFREVWSAREPDEKLGHDGSVAKLGGIIRGNRQIVRGNPRTQDGATKHRTERIGRFPHRIPSSDRSLSPLQSPGHSEARNRGQMSLKRLQEAALIEATHGTRSVTGGSGFAKASVAGRDRGSVMGGSGLGEGCLGSAIIQGYCNWLLDGKSPRVRLLACFGKATNERSEVERLTDAITLSPVTGRQRFCFLPSGRTLR